MVSATLWLANVVLVAMLVAYFGAPLFTIKYHPPPMSMVRGVFLLRGGGGIRKGGRVSCFQKGGGSLTCARGGGGGH